MVIESIIKNFFLNLGDTRLYIYWTVICYIKFVFIFKYGNILDLLRDLAKSPVARDLFIKLDSIGARILIIDVGFKNCC